MSHITDPCDEMSVQAAFNALINNHEWWSMINPLRDGGGEINPFTNYISTKYKLINVWMLIKTLPLLFISGDAGEDSNFWQDDCWRLREGKKCSLHSIQTENVKWQRPLFADILHQLQSYPVSRIWGNAIDYLSKVAEVNIMAAIFM